MNTKVRSYISSFCIVLLLLLSISLLAFSLMSGSQNSGPLMNIPNVIPWILLIVIVCIAFRWQILGGILIIFFGICTIIFFSALEFLWILFLISLPLIIIGSFFAWNGFLARHE